MINTVTKENICKAQPGEVICLVRVSLPFNGHRSFFFFLLEWLCPQLIAKSAADKGQRFFAARDGPFAIGQHAHAIKLVFYEQSEGCYQSRHIFHFLRHNGGEGVGGRRWGTGARTGLEAGPVTPRSASPGGAWKRRHGELRQDQQLR